MKKIKDLVLKLVGVLRSPIFFSLYFILIFILYCSHHELVALGVALTLLLRPVRYAIANFDRLFISFVCNTFNFFRYREYNYPDMIGTIDVFVAHTRKVFGCAKTLSAVVLVRKLYDKFNGAKTYDYKCSKPHWVTWSVRVISNVSIEGVPVVPFVSLQQLVDLSGQDNDGIFTIVLLDECNAVLNSRNFKSNLNEEQIKSIVTCRHNNMCMFLVGQRFKYLDALVRSMTDRVIECVHIPLFNTVVHYIYSAYDLENIDNPAMIKPIGKKYNYIHQWQYHLYDTKALVNNIAKSDSLSSAEVLANKGIQQFGAENARNLSHKGKKLLKKQIFN